ncbi:MAG: 3-isopropylmalate dehydratase small subunit [Thermodesulfobacteriota bacterium]|nr:3-isopropylmalate dehydratase small subunit [Thermodesulfobacteriota bacterium]
MKIKGKVWKFGHGITTDHIAPGRFFYLRSNLPEFAKHCFEDVRPDFISKVKPGDFVVGGENFGFGSSREHAPIMIKLCGIGAVLAKSYARIFFRNAINSGLPALILDTDQINDGDELEIDLGTGTLKNITTGREMTAPPLPPVMQAIIHEGGLVEHIKKHGRLKLD